MEVNLKGCTTCEKRNHGSLGWMQWTTLLWLWSWWDAAVTIPKMALWGPPWAEFSDIRLDPLLHCHDQEDGASRRALASLL